jgi:hypothetical protein
MGANFRLGLKNLLICLHAKAQRKVGPALDRTRSNTGNGTGYGPLGMGGVGIQGFSRYVGEDSFLTLMLEGVLPLTD